VFEAAPAISPASSPLGTSLSLWPNAMACLARWGIKQLIAESGQEIAQIAWRRPDGRPFFVQALAGLYQDLGHNGICIRRSDLHRHLLAALDPSQVHLGHRLISAMQQDGQVDLEFAGGTRLAARQVIGADGLSSVLRRQQVQGAQDPIYAGLWRVAGAKLRAIPQSNAQ
jgi:2-polyprenyl-6-methoxyphenol hydroxylase-like FAD-dependent oxidoreductase